MGDTEEEKPKRCPACDHDLSKPGLDLARLSWVFEEKLVEDVRKGAKFGCLLCKIIVSVLDDAEAVHACYFVERHDGKSFWVTLKLRNGRWLLALENIWMPMPFGFQSPFPGNITVYVDGQDTPVYGLESYQAIPSFGGSSQCLDLAAMWLSECRSKHPACSRQSRRLSYPARFLDIDKVNPRVIVHETEESPISYVALSHCWGGAQPLRSLSNNLEVHKQGIPLDQFPNTFRDAIKMSRALGFRYLWIDSLCILQDHSEDWEEQSSQMSAIYSNADLVLGAAAAASASEGFLHARPGFREGSVRVDIGDSPGPPTLFKYRLVYHRSATDPLDRRAWAFQERLCAKHYLAYGAWEMVWECNAASLCECEWVRFARRRPFDLVVNLERLFETTHSKDIWECWRLYVMHHYKGKQITHATDKLVALSAIAERFQAKGAGIYLAGLWRRDLIRELLWKSAPTSNSYGEAFYAPTWSWVSVHRILDVFMWYSGEEEKRLAAVLDARTTLSSVNRFGPVSSGVIKLSGRMIKATVTTKMWANSGDFELTLLEIGHRWRVSLDATLVNVDVDLKDGTREATARRPQPGERCPDLALGFAGWLLPLLADRFILQGFKIYHGLFLSRSTTHIGCYERIGLAEYIYHSHEKSGDEVDILADYGPPVEVTIV